MTSKDREHTSFTNDRGTYCYQVMPFRLNARAIYQRMVSKIFKHYIRRNVKVYVIKSKTIESHLANLVKNFQIIKKYNMPLNPTKCAFEVKSEKFLKFIMHKRGIDANPKKVQVILEMCPPQSIKEV